MLKDLVGIEIQGANFETPTKLVLFPSLLDNKTKTNKGLLLYGRNGSGKSTIARGFRSLAGESVPAIQKISAFDENNNSVALDQNEKERIFVFDEDFVDKNVKIQEDGLESIVMLGEQVGLSEKIEVAERKLTEAKTAYDLQEKVLAEYRDINNIKSPKNIILKLRFALQGDDNWAGRDKLIRDGRQNTGVHDDTYEQFVHLSPTKTKNELLVEYEHKKAELITAKSGNAVIAASVPALPEKFKTYDYAHIQKLLAIIIEKPDLSEREQKLLHMVQTGKTGVLLQEVETLEDDTTVICPYCFQPLSSAYKGDLVQSIKKVLSKEVEKHQQLLRAEIRGEIPLDITPFEKLQSFASCKDLIVKIDESVKVTNGLLQKKIDDPYTPIDADISYIQDMTSELIELLSHLEKELVDYNKQAKATTPIVNEMIRINSEIAHYDIIDLANQYQAQKEALESEEARYKELKTMYMEAEKEVEDLQAERKNVKLATNVINSCLKYIFFAEDRLSIEYSNGTYKLFSHGKSVSPHDVSVGERNIIGLCYFFASILQGQEENDAYNKNYLIIIDDPISSYDTENRIGILSFLKYRLGAFLEGNIDTKVLVMTHDLLTFYDMHKVLEEIIESCRRQGYTNPPIFLPVELKNKALNLFSYRKRQEYSELISTVYSYGNNRDGEQDIVIGNIMRQVLEAFSTFEYKKGIDDVSNDPTIISSLGDAEYENYFRNLMYRLVLHGTSHREEQVKSMHDLSFFAVISESEKRRTARDILCFIFLLNKAHLLAHLSPFDQDAETTLSAWCQEIKKRSIKGI